MNLIDRAVLVVVNVTTARLIEPERLEEQLRLVVKVILLVRRHFTQPWLAHLAVQAVFAQAEARKGRRRGNLAALSALGAHATSSSRCNAKNAHIGTEYKTDGPRTVHALAVDYDLSAVRRQLHYAPGQPAQRALAAASGWTLAPLDLVARSLSERGRTLAKTARVRATALPSHTKTRRAGSTEFDGVSCASSVCRVGGCRV